MALGVNDILDFIRSWRSNNGLSDNIKLSENQIEQFVKELHAQIEQMDFYVKEGTTIVGYSGDSNGKNAWKVAKKVSEITGKNAIYISDLPAGTLIGEYRPNLVIALSKVVGKSNVEKIISGYDSDKRIAGGSCGFGEGLLSLDDFVSAKLMGETKGANSNLIVFVPEGVDPTKVFAVTELDRIFANETFSTINGIPKGQLQSIYKSGTVGRQAVYAILTATAKEAVGDISGIEEQANALVKAMGSNGLLNEGSNSFTISGCYDNIGNLIGIQLDEKGKGTIIEPPQGTAYKSEFANTNTYIDEGRMAELFGEERYNNLSDYGKKQAVDLVNELDEFLNTSDSVGDTASKSNTSSDTDTKKGATGNSDTGTKHTETNNSESGKTNTSDSSNKSTETNESSSSNNSDTKKTNVSDTGLNDDSKGTQNEIKDTESSIHTGTGDADIKDANSSKYIPGESTSDKSTSSKKGRDVDLESESAKKYLGATGKAADELDDIDKAMINIADKYANNPKGVSDFAKSLGKYDDILKAGTNTLGYVDAVCTAIYAVQAVYDASKAYEEGNTNNAIGIVAGAVAELVVSTVGAMAIASAISACLMAVGGYREE